MYFMYVLYVCMYVCMYVCVYVCMCVCMYVCMYVCLYVCVYVCMCVCMCVCMYVCMYVCTYVRMCMYICAYVCMYVCMCVSIYVCVCMYAHIQGVQYNRPCPHYEGIQYRQTRIIFHLSARQRRVFNFTPLPHHLRRKNTLYSLNKGLGDPQILSGRFGEEKFTFLTYVKCILLILLVWTDRILCTSYFAI